MNTNELNCENYSQARLINQYAYLLNSLYNIDICWQKSIIISCQPQVIAYIITETNQ